MANLEVKMFRLIRMVSFSVGLLTLATVWLWTPAPAAAAPFGIAIDSGSPYFLPKAAIVAPHAPIRWENTTSTHHTITHQGCEGGGMCVFDSGTLAPDQSYELPGLPPGTYPYLCRLHPIMRGVLIVQEASASF
jgi:plastocyanin